MINIEYFIISKLFFYHNKILRFIYIYIFDFLFLKNIINYYIDILFILIYIFKIILIFIYIEKYF